MKFHCPLAENIENTNFRIGSVDIYETMFPGLPGENLLATARELKESFSVLRADLNAQGLDVMFSYENLVDVLTYLALCNNHFSTSRGSDRSLLEMVSGRKLSKPVCTLYGSQVLAKIPDSIRQHSPLSTRNVECTFIHMGLERGPVAQGFIRVDGKAELMRFVAGTSGLFHL